MKGHDFWFQKNRNTMAAICGGLLAMCALSVYAEDGPSIESFDAPTELILSPSDQLLPVEPAPNASLMLSNSAGSAESFGPTDKRKTQPVNLGCGVDVNQLPTDDNSLRGRFVGECNLKLRY